MDYDFPYRSEYAKSSRSNCRGCKSCIEQGKLRLAVMVQSPVFDGKTPNWYHMNCFFKKQRPTTVDDIQHFESLRYEDQEKVRKNIGNSTGIIVPDEKPKKGKKRDAGTMTATAKKAALKDFKIEYAKSSRAFCRGCEQKIMKDEVRISKKDFTTEVGKKYGGQDMWHHLTCFAKVRSDLGYYESAEYLPGFKELSKPDQTEAKLQLQAIKQEALETVVKKVKMDKEELDETEALFRDQNKIMYKYRDQLKDSLHKKQLVELLEYNEQAVPAGEDRILDRLSDIMTFGALAPCKICKDGQYVFNKVGYICHGDLTEWTKCNNVEKTPVRVPFTVPKEFALEYPFLKKYKYVKRDRLIRDINPTCGVKNPESEENAGPRVQRERPPLYNMEFVILGNPARGKEQLKKDITILGGKVTTKIKNTVMAVIASKEFADKMGARIREAQDEDVHVVPEEFVDLAKGQTGKICELVVSKSLCDWGSDPAKRLPQEASTSSFKSGKSISIYTSKMPSKIKLKLKGGTAVDPESELEDQAHVYQSNGDKYTAILGVTDIQRQKNSYYKLQLLEADGGNKYWVFRSWGRIGTTIGSTKLEIMSSLHQAKAHFQELYEEKTGNCWEDRHFFVKVPGRMFPIDVDYGEEEQSVDLTDAPSNLDKPIADLIRLIFDVKQMKQMMLEFELDMEKMPLGKISKKQILSALTVLTELQGLIKNNDSNKSKYIDASNRFYTLIPHSFGVNDPPLLNNDDIIKQKTEMLDSLMELEVAYSLMKSSGNENHLDNYYSKLNTEIKSLPSDHSDYAIIKEYLKNTHAATHQAYALDIEEIYTIKRQGEERRYKPFKKLHNKKLLWHGSRVTNFAGILSQGLRIAPPEAPTTGYMFGKGVYFADMVSKSANYCFTSPGSTTGLLMLCEVALGNEYQLTQSKFVEKLPKGKHSTKGLGHTFPNPEESKMLDDVEVPLGTSVTKTVKNGALLYNEYIVYDVAQIQAKYLLKVNFKYKY